MRLLLVDGHYYAYRSFYAIRHLTNSRGEPTNALYGLAKALKRMIAELRPDAAAFILDGGLDARIELQPDYKANRSETPPDLLAQFDHLGDVARVLGFTPICVDGEEADDLIASYAREASRRGVEVVIATNDKDIMQLVGPGREPGHGAITIYQPVTGGGVAGAPDFALLDAAAVFDKWGVPPERIGDLLTLTGDAVDNIPGVPGVGPKTAATLITQHGTLDLLLALLDADPDGASPGLKAKIKSDKLRAALCAAHRSGHLARNRVMVSLRDALALPVPLDGLALRPDFAAQAALFARFEFKTFQREAEARLLVPGAAPSALPASPAPLPPPAPAAPAVPFAPPSSKGPLVQGDFLL
ncbi:DNA polymerase-1 [Verrucomicrobium sp. GAS474]|uniref:5'-3' exonuclease n=1 Tax=Verrucomicrobium sp. GAS474 TaxID=1882831 RepID=UPI00087C37E3|nr:5'-3' exonuclease H3TH domain-containing protein [Verrucomicrobium sp. GAS474]SDT92592.1 DNA polymerase-1 [Verrucomicrobium sp. GAS474]